MNSKPFEAALTSDKMLRKRPSNEDLEMFRNKCCKFCKVACDEIDSHLLRVHPEYFSDQSGAGPSPDINGTRGKDIQLIRVKTAFDETAVEYETDLSNETIVDNFYERVSESSVQVVQNELKQKKGMKVFSSMKVRFTKTNSVTKITETREQGFTTFAHRLLHKNQVRKVVFLMKEKILNQIEYYTEEKSGWTVEEILHFAITMLHYPPLFASSYVKLPYPLDSKVKSLRNVNNEKPELDDRHLKCFLWSVLAHDELAARYIKKDSNRARKLSNVKSYLNFQHLVNMEGISYPVEEPAWRRFENQNESISLTIIAYDYEKPIDTRTHERIEQMEESEEPYISRENEEYNIIKSRSYLVYASKFPQRPLKVDLLLLMSSKKSHYVLINNLSAFRANPNNRGYREICRHCLHPFKSLSTLQAHQMYCLQVGAQETCFSEDEVLKFRNFDKTVMLPFAIFLDFEAFVRRFYGPEPEFDPKTKNTAWHTPSGYFWWCEDHLGTRLESNWMRVPDNESSDVVAVCALREIVKLTQRLDERYETIQMESKQNMKITETDLRAAKAQGVCCICKQNFGEEDDFDNETKIAKHHNHLEPFNFIGLAHNSCNLNARLKPRYPVFIHNGGGYDFHFFVKAIAKLETEELVTSARILPKTTERYLCITLNNNLVLLDSFCFTNASLASLAESLLKSGREKFKAVQQAFEGQDVDLLLKGKGLYPYTLMEGVQDFERPFPSRKEFYNDLAEQDVNEDSYQNVKMIWDQFKCKNMGDWHDLYVKLDTVYLADVMRELRAILFKKYEVDLYQYVSIASLSFDCMMKFTQIELEHITDPDMYLFWELSIRGGYCSPGSLRYARANNKYMGEYYNPSEPSTYILYMDANNLCWLLSRFHSY